MTAAPRKGVGRAGPDGRFLPTLSGAGLAGSGMTGLRQTAGNPC